LAVTGMRSLGEAVSSLAVPPRTYWSNKRHDIQ
jgi:hypothetical protein